MMGVGTLMGVGSDGIVVENPTREIEAKLAEDEGLALRYGKLLAKNMGIYQDGRPIFIAVMRATDAQRLRAIGAVLRGRKQDVN